VKKKKNLRLLFFLLGFLFIWLVDNWLAKNCLVVKNYGISFGINGVFFLCLNIFFILFLSWYWVIKIFGNIGVFLILTGGWLNLIDRIRFGFVSDYWKFFGLYNNLADWIIGIGILIFLVEELWKKKCK